MCGFIRGLEFVNISRFSAVRECRAHSPSQLAEIRRVVSELAHFVRFSVNSVNFVTISSTYALKGRSWEGGHLSLPRTTGAKLRTSELSLSLAKLADLGFPRPRPAVAAVAIRSGQVARCPLFQWTGDAIMNLTTILGTGK